MRSVLTLGKNSYKIGAKLCCVSEHIRDSTPTDLTGRRNREWNDDVLRWALDTQMPKQLKASPAYTSPIQQLAPQRQYPKGAGVDAVGRPVVPSSCQ